MKITNLSKTPRNDLSVKAAIFGPFGIGKTSLLKTLDEPTLCLDCEAGLLSVQDSDVDVISLKSWEEARDITCLICGGNSAIRRDQPYSQQHYDYCVKKYPGVSDLSKYRCIFIDSITVASRLCLEFAKANPDVLNTKTGRPDLRSAYGILVSEILTWVNQFQHLHGVNVIFIGGLD